MNLKDPAVLGYEGFRRKSSIFSEDVLECLGNSLAKVSAIHGSLIYAYESIKTFGFDLISFDSVVPLSAEMRRDTRPC